MGWPEDLEASEQGGTMDMADPETISKEAIKRGRPQLGTLGAGNHFLEIQVVDEIYEPEIAQAFGITEPGQITDHDPHRQPWVRPPGVRGLACT